MSMDSKTLRALRTRRRRLRSRPRGPLCSSPSLRWRPPTPAGKSEVDDPDNEDADDFDGGAATVRRSPHFTPSVVAIILAHKGRNGRGCKGATMDERDSCCNPSQIRT